jgi:hypothetical protein
MSSEFSLSHLQKIEGGELDTRFSTLRKLASALLPRVFTDFFTLAYAAVE